MLIEMGLENSSNERAIYEAAVEFECGEFHAFIYLYYSKFALVTVRLGQEGRFRRHYWRYDQITNVIKRNQDDQKQLYINVEDDQSEELTIGLLFCTQAERDRCAFRLKMLSNIYNPCNKLLGRKSEKTCPSSAISSTLNKSFDIANEKDEEDAIISEMLDTSNGYPKMSPPPKEKTTIPTKSPAIASIDDMFSVENLEKLAGCSESSELIAKTLTSVPTSTTNLLVPIEIRAGDSSQTLNAQAKITLRLNIDLASISETREVKNREDRLAKIRKLIQIDATQCELCFT